MAAVANTAEEQCVPAILSPYHLTARPWQPFRIPRKAYLEAAESMCRALLQYQDARGAIVDPYLKREQQCCTPYVAATAAYLLSEGRARDLLEPAALATDHATCCLAAGLRKIPNECGEFYLGPLAEALEWLRCFIRGERWTEWQRRTRTPVAQIIGGSQGHLNHLRTYAMRGEWLRTRLALVDRGSARAYIERHWTDTQRDRLARDLCGLYQDRTSDPDSYACDAAARVNLLGLTAAEYSGASADGIARAAERGTVSSLLMQDPTGQCPPNGLGDNHVFHDVLYQTAFERLAERARGQSRAWLAGQFRRAALLSFRGIERWKRDGEAAYFVTKNRQDPELRAGYQPASSYTSANSIIMAHMLDSYRASTEEIEERPAPAEIGGYAFATDPRFATVFANAGGMQVVANLRGDVNGSYGVNWTALGLVRFSRAGWDSRLGPSDGMADQDSCRSVSFGPTWTDQGRWVRLADFPEHYKGTFQAGFVHPLLVRCSIEYSSARRGAPSFVIHCVITPDGVLARVDSPSALVYGVTWPLLINDGEVLETSIGRYIASVSYPGGGDQQNFIALGPSAGLTSDEPVHGGYGLMKPVRSRSNLTLVYPRSAGDPEAEDVRTSYQGTIEAFSTVLGRVEGTLYVGRTSAGGVGEAIDLNGDGAPDVIFSTPCGFLLQLDQGRVIALEADRDVRATLSGRQVDLHAFEPLDLK